jgi:thymidylate kinase
VIGLLRRNKVPLMELDPGGPGRGAGWSEAVEEERRQRDELADEFALVAGALRNDGIVPVLFKSAGGLPYRSSNIDLLVRPGQMAQAASRLEQLGHLRFPHYREDHKLLFRRFRRGRSVICVHLHEAVSWGRILILPGSDVVDRSRLPRSGESGFMVASSEDLLLITLAHSLYETDQIRLSDLRALRLAAGDPGFDWSVAIERARRHGWTTGFFSILTIAADLEQVVFGATRVPAGIRRQAGQALEGSMWARLYVARMKRACGPDLPDLPYPLSRTWSKIHAAALMMAAPDRSPDERLMDLVSTAENLLATRMKLRCRPPVLVSLTGLDGSGKSSAIRVVGEAMSLCEIPTRIVWSRGGFTLPAQAAKRATRAVMGDKVPGPAAMEEKRRWLSGGLTGSVYASLVVAEQAVHYLLRVILPRWGGSSIVCDRYVYDTWADLEVKLSGSPRIAGWAGGLLLALAPEPDLALLLHLAPEEAARRKPADASMGVLTRQAEFYERMSALLGLRVIDAGRPDAEVIDEVVDLALRKAFAKFAGEES